MTVCNSRFRREAEQSQSLTVVVSYLGSPNVTSFVSFGTVFWTVTREAKGLPPRIHLRLRCHDLLFLIFAL